MKATIEVITSNPNLDPRIQQRQTQQVAEQSNFAKTAIKEAAEAVKNNSVLRASVKQKTTTPDGAMREDTVVLSKKDDEQSSQPLFSRPNPFQSSAQGSAIKISFGPNDNPSPPSKATLSSSNYPAVKVSLNNSGNNPVNGTQAGAFKTVTVSA